MLSHGAVPNYNDLPLLLPNSSVKLSLRFYIALQVRKNSSLMPKRRSLDLQDILMNPPSWLPIGSSPELSGKEDDKNSVYGDWVDKIMVNKLENASRDENSAAHLEVDNRQLPHEMFGQSHNGRYEMATDDSDELEAATSDSSEPDVLSQLTLPKVTNIPNGVGSKTKKTNPRKAKSSESRYFSSCSYFSVLLTSFWHVETRCNNNRKLLVSVWT